MKPVRLGLWSGVGLVSSNMIGTGIFLSSAYMMKDLSPGWILCSWVLGALLGMLGSVSYAELARQLPRSGGEYQYIGTFLSRPLGYLAGWASLFVAFAAPSAVCAIAAAEFLNTLVAVPTKLVALGLLLWICITHCFSMRGSKRTQDILAIVKIVLVVGFAVLGLALGNWHWPTSTRDAANAPGFSLSGFVSGQLFIAYAFSGWNASAYVSENFENPERDVGRSMLLGCAIVAVLYLAVNWVLVANADLVDATEASSDVTLAQIVAKKLLGELGGKLMAIVLVITFVSTMSALVWIGPRIASSMAKDGWLPSLFHSPVEKPPVAGLIAICAVAATIVFWQSIRDALWNVGAILTLFSGLSSLSLLTHAYRKRTVRLFPIVAGAVYVPLCGWIVYMSFRSELKLVLGCSLAANLLLMCYPSVERRRQKDLAVM